MLSDRLFTCAISSVEELNPDFGSADPSHHPVRLTHRRHGRSPRPLHARPLHPLHPRPLNPMPLSASGSAPGATAENDVIELRHQTPSRPPCREGQRGRAAPKEAAFTHLELPPPRLQRARAAARLLLPLRHVPGTSFGERSMCL